MSSDSSNFLPTYRQYPLDNDSYLQRQLVNGYTDIALAVNNREIGSYSTDIKPTGQQWFSLANNKLREGRRVVLQFTIDASGTTTIPHGISFTATTYVTNIYGTATNGTNIVPIPCASAVAAQIIQMGMDHTNVILTTTAGAYIGPPVYTGTIVVEFV